MVFCTTVSGGVQEDEKVKTLPLTFVGGFVSAAIPLLLWGYALVFDRTEIYGNLTFGMCIGALLLNATISYSQFKDGQATKLLTGLWLACTVVALGIFVVLFRRAGAEADIVMFAVMSALTFPLGLLAFFAAAILPLQSEISYMLLWSLFVALGWFQSFVLLPRLFSK